MDSSTLELHPLHRGAEADLFLSELPPWKAVVKRRVRKAYRHEELDAKIRKERTVKESSAIHEAKIAGARTPSILGLDLERSSIIMTFIEGKVARDAIDTMVDSRRLHLLEEIGRQVGLLHSAGIVHGDLTTSNIILPEDERPFIIDFGMASRSSEPEDRGTDLHLIQSQLLLPMLPTPPTHSGEAPKEYRKMPAVKKPDPSLGKAAEIARRGRYFAIR